MSATGLEVIHSPESGEIFCVLLSIMDPTLGSQLLPINVCTDNADTFEFEAQTTRGIIYGGTNYVWFPFEISMPSISGDTAPSAQLSISGVDQRVIQAVRDIKVAPQVDISVIVTSQRDVGGYSPEITLEGFRLRDIQYDVTSVSGSLTFEQLLNEPYPFRSFNPSDFPGMHA